MEESKKIIEKEIKDMEVWLVILLQEKGDDPLIGQVYDICKQALQKVKKEVNKI